MFAESLKDAVYFRKKRAKSPRKIRYFFYCSWAKMLIKGEVGPENAEYSYPPAVLQYIRSICPGDIVGEIRPNAYKVTMEVFCNSLEIPKVMNV